MSTKFRLQENLSEAEKLEALKKKFRARINGARYDWRFKGVREAAALTRLITGELSEDKSEVTDFDKFVDQLLAPAPTPVVEFEHQKFPLKSLRANDKIRPYKEQISAAEDILSVITNKGYLVEYIAATGEGKTFVLGGVISELVERGFFKRPLPCPVAPCWLLTAATAITQTERVLHGLFGISRSVLKVTNYEDLRSLEACKSFMDIKDEVVNGSETTSYSFRPLMWPKLIICDESHKLKNWPDSIQSKIIMSFANIHNMPRPEALDELFDETYLIRASATPGSRVSDFAISLVASRVEL